MKLGLTALLAAFLTLVLCGEPRCNHVACPSRSQVCDCLHLATPLRVMV